MPDAYSVVDCVIAGMRFIRQSQPCIADCRLFLHADVFDSFLAKLRAKTQALKLGDPLAEDTQIGKAISGSRRSSPTRRTTGSSRAKRFSG
jgi:acyl-CoA reductase-like NAD-dependent aldehyde dehydrogenase